MNKKNNDTKMFCLYDIFFVTNLNFVTLHVKIV